jgi:hypothetical protein
MDGPVTMVLVINKEINWRWALFEVCKVLFGLAAGAVLVVNWERHLWLGFWILAGVTSVWAVAQVCSGVQRDNLVRAAHELAESLIRKSNDG